MAILRRGEGIASKFLGATPGKSQTEGSEQWNSAKKYQQLFTFSKGEILHIELDWWPDTEIQTYNLRIHGDSYEIWFDYFKCMFNSYLGEDWERVAQLTKPPENKGINTETWKGGDNPTTAKNTPEVKREYIIKLFDSENMFKYGVEKFSVDNEIHKFLQHMIKEGFDFTPEIIWFKSVDEDNNMDWFVKSFTNQLKHKNWDRYYEYANNGNASWEIFPYQTKKDYTYHEQLGEDEQYDEGSKTLDKEGISYDNAFDEDNSGQGD